MKAVKIVPFPYGGPEGIACGADVPLPAVAVDLAQIEEEAFARGIVRGRETAEQQLTEEKERLRLLAAAALKNFEFERERHLRRMEAECAGLALAIARKILQREAETDPLMMQAAVRIALERVDAATSIKLRVPSADAGHWDKSMASGANAVQIIADAALAAPELVLETELGTAELGWTAQIKEVERGFLEMLSERPGTLQ